MQIIVNGSCLEVDSGFTLLALLDHMGKPSAHVAVEHNGEIVERNDFSSVTLDDKDRLEIVHFVGGG
jgi:thiamine biosynthesis protein ThiS